MRMNILKGLVLSASTLMVMSCGEDELAPITITAEEFVTTIAENPEDGALLGDILANTNRGTLSYEIMSQDTDNAIAIDPVTGMLSVGDVSAYDFEERVFVTAMVKVINEGQEKAVTARVNITDGIDNPKSEALIAHYPLDVEATDISDYGNDGVITGTTPGTDSQGIPGGALIFNGDSDFIEVSHADQLNISEDISFSAFVRVDEMKTGTILTKGAAINGSGTVPYSISVAGNGLIVLDINMSNGSANYMLRENTYTLGEWTMITGVVQDEVFSLYINGELAESINAPGMINTNSFPLLIGTRSGSVGNTFKGAIDDVRIYDDALSAKEVRELYGNYSL